MSWAQASALVAVWPLDTAVSGFAFLAGAGAMQERVRTLQVEDFRPEAFCCGLCLCPGLFGPSGGSVSIPTADDLLHQFTARSK